MANPNAAPSAEPLEARRLFATIVHFSIDPQQNLHPISRFIYGVNQSLSGAYANNTFERLGGNRWTAYNWENNASNAGSDYQYQNDNYLGGGTTPGGAVIPAIQDAANHNAGALVTVPINGYVSADTSPGGDVRNSGSNYLSTRFKIEKAVKGSAFTLTPSTSDAYVYEDEFVNWVKTKFPYGQTDPNKPIWFSLDNEPDLWSSTHAEVHPSATTYAELVQKNIDYASAIKSVQPAAKVYGPADYGWQGYVSLQNAPDAAGRDWLTFYLQQMKQAGQTAGRRLLDVLDLHWYPEATGGGIRITGSDTSAAVVAARLQAPRSLWDPTYTETSWITQYSTNGPIDLIPRIQGKIDANYAGTKLSFSEYNYGGGADISGGIAQADVLGIFGRSGVFSANEWPLAGNESFIGGAFQMFRNYNGAGGAFGDTSIAASTDDVAGSSVYASLDSANRNVMTIVAINKTASAVSASVQLNHVLTSGAANVYQLTSASAAPVAAGTLNVAGLGAFTYAMPAYSVSTIRIPISALPAGWTDADLGAPATGGVATADQGTNAWTLSGGGVGIVAGAMSDQFNFASEPFATDGAIGAKILSAAGQAGVMFRNGAGASAAFADLLATPGGQVAFQWRSVDGAATQSTATTLALPAWVKLVRSSGNVAAYVSTNGTTWTQLGVAQPITLGAGALAGLADSAVDNTGYATASFSNVGFVALPANVVVAAQSGFAPTITWTASPGATSYAIERSTAGGAFAPIGVAPASAASFADTGLSPGTLYAYRITASAGPITTGYTAAARAYTLLPGDANGDGTVTFADFVLLSNHFGQAAGATWAAGDFNNDGKVDFADFVQLSNNFGTALPPVSAPSFSLRNANRALRRDR